MMMNEADLRDTTESLHLPAEWHSCGCVMIAWPHKDTDWNYMLDEIEQCYIHLVEVLVKYSRVLIVCPEIDIPQRRLSHLPAERIFYFRYITNDTWIRDYGPLTLVDDAGIPRAFTDYRFNGWGLKFPACFDNLAIQDMRQKSLLALNVYDRRDFVLEGGGIESDGNGNLMTTAACQLSPNRNPTMSKADIIERLKSDFGAENVVWLNNGALAGDDTDSHIDTLARFAPGNTIVYTCCNDPSDEHFYTLQAMKEELKLAKDKDGNNFNLVELPLPSPVYDSEGQRLPATYSNYLVLPDVVLMPTYSQPVNDILAKRILEAVYERTVECVECSALINQHGSLHCATMQIPEGALSFC